MNITLESIDELRVRANVGYKEAKEALIQTEGNMVEALIYIEEKYGVKTSHKRKVHKDLHKQMDKLEKSEAVSNFKSGFRSFMKKKFIVSKEGKTFLNIPLFIAILAVLITEGFGLVVLAIGYFTGFKYSFDDACQGSQCNQEKEVVEKETV